MSGSSHDVLHEGATRDNTPDDRDASSEAKRNRLDHQPVQDERLHGLSQALQSHLFSNIKAETHEDFEITDAINASSEEGLEAVSKTEDITAYSSNMNENSTSVSNMEETSTNVPRAMEEEIKTRIKTLEYEKEELGKQNMMMEAKLKDWVADKVTLQTIQVEEIKWEKEKKALQESLAEEQTKQRDNWRSKHDTLEAEYSKIYQQNQQHLHTNKDQLLKLQELCKQNTELEKERTALVSRWEWEKKALQESMAEGQTKQRDEWCSKHNTLEAEFNHLQSEYKNLSLQNQRHLQTNKDQHLKELQDVHEKNAELEQERSTQVSRWEMEKKAFQESLANEQIKQIEGWRKYYDELSEAYRKLDKENQHNLQTIENIKFKLEEAYTQNTDLEKERSTLVVRLSKIAGAKLTTNNANIADLSDVNRPTKLAEKFSELYDNEWTDAYEEVCGGMEEENGVTYMLQLLQRAYVLCKDLANSHIEAMKASATTVKCISKTNARLMAYPRKIVTEENQEVNTGVSNGGLQDGSFDNMGIDHQDHMDVDDAEENVITSNLTVNKTSKQGGDPISAGVEENDATPNTERRVNAMPGASVSSTDKGLMITISAPIELPAELLKQIMDMRKYIGLQMETLVIEKITEAIATEFSIDLEKRPLTFTYIRTCVQLCWSMGLKDPPVYMNIQPPGEHTKFDTDVYKAYTKIGKLLHYIVWPALYLHEGGPLLSKGVAQGEGGK